LGPGDFFFIMHRSFVEYQQNFLQRVICSLRGAFRCQGGIPTFRRGIRYPCAVRAASVLLPAACCHFYQFMVL
jgi:hypothetical protein